MSAPLQWKQLGFDVPSLVEMQAEGVRDFLRRDESADLLAPWVNPGAMTEAQRADLVAKIEAGEVTALRFRAIVFGEARNANKVEFKREHVVQLAKSAGGQNLLNGHGSWFSGSDMANVVGSVLGGSTMKREGTGETVLVLDHRIGEKEAMLNFAKWLWRSFSISIGADKWAYAWLDKDGKELEQDENGEPVKGWRHVKDYRVRPVGAVSLRHNAFVADPAYAGTAVVDLFNMGIQKEFSVMGDNAQLEGLLAQVAALQAQKDAAELKAQEEGMKRFEVAWTLAVAKGQALPAEFEAQKKIAASKEFGVDFAIAQIQARPVALAVGGVGAPPSATPLNAGQQGAGGGAGAGVGGAGGLGLNSVVGGTEIIFGAATKEQQDELLAEQYPNGPAAKRVAARRAGGRG